MLVKDLTQEQQKCVNFACLLCLEKRNIKTFNKNSPCALRSIRGEICDELERVLYKDFTDVKLQTKDYICDACGEFPKAQNSQICKQCQEVIDG